MKKYFKLMILPAVLLALTTVYFVTNNVKEELVIQYKDCNYNKTYKAKNIFINDIDGEVNFSNLQSNSLTLNFKDFKVKYGTLKDIKNFTGKELYFRPSAYGLMNIGADTIEVSDEDLNSITKWSGIDFYLPIQTLSKEVAMNFSKMNVKVFDLAVVNCSQEIIDIVSSNKNVEIFGAPFN